MKIISKIPERRTPFRVVVPRIMDAKNVNAQNLNAKAMLARFDDPDFEWHAFHYGAPDPVVAANPRIVLHRLWRRHLWTWHLISHYLKPYDAVFYPGIDWYDAVSLRMRRRLRGRGPVIATLEGLQGDETRAAQLSASMGAPVFCYWKSQEKLRSYDEVYRQADHIVPLTPFFETIARALYGKSLAPLTLGIEAIFQPPSARPMNERLRVMSVGSLQPWKRPEVFLELARKFPDADFCWYGDGPLRASLESEVRQRNLLNLQFLAPVTPPALAACFGRSDIFVLPSHSESVSKASQEAAACGLPVVLFGFYQTPAVSDGDNGFVVWSDDELSAKIRLLLSETSLRQRMGSKGARMAKDWSWDQVAPRWQSLVRSLVTGHRH